MTTCRPPTRLWQVTLPTSDLLKELQGLPVTMAVIYRNVDRKACWEQIAKEHQVATVVVVVASSLK